MRKAFNAILKQTFHEHLIRYRNIQGLTQVQMADRLTMEPRSYADLDRGKTTCTALTLVRFLIYCCDDPQKFLNELRVQFDAIK